jgi:hypothetical protein
MSTSVLIVERPGQFRDVLLREVSTHGAEAHVRDDAMEALASLERLAPNIVLVSDDPGPPGAVSLCRLLRRKLKDTAVYRLGEPSLADVIDEKSFLLPRAVGAPAIANALLNRSASWSAHRAWNAPLGSLELGPLLLAIGTRWLTGRLLLTRPGTEREIAFVRGMPVYARSSVLSERVGAIGIRRGLFNETQLEQALDLSHARGMRVGEALLELGALDAPRLFGVLSAQLVEQLAAACNAGACQARFMLDQTQALRGSLLRLSPMTALLHAAQQTPIEDIERVLDELAERPLSNQPLPRAVEQWLSDLQLPEAGELALQATSVRALRQRIRDKLPTREGSPLSPDTVTVALLRSGAFTMSGRTSLVPNDLRAGIRTLSPPSIASAIVRCAHSSFEDWGVSAFAHARTPLELGIDEYLHGKRPPEAARSLALLGPEAECDEAHAEVYALYLRISGAQHAVSLPGVKTNAVSELRLRSHELLQRLDALEAEHAAPIARAQIVQTRASLERLLSTLPTLDPVAQSPAQVESGRPTMDSRELQPVSSMPPTAARASSSTSTRPEPIRSSLRPHAIEQVDPALASVVEPLVEQGRWQELRTLIAERFTDPRELPAGIGLIYAIALKEAPALALDEFGEKPVAHAETLGIRAVSQLLAVPEQSALAVVIAKRVLRQRPHDWNQKPPVRVSALLVMVALLTGALAGLLLHPNLLGLLGK